ncbi:DUF3472 domain-containing protein [Rugamonas sp. CCM 8940]|uniref:DUF3472 domain-containing protein n=1 Tax=Rugamonas sp. CCM 8940 TaxID=2765359 RepID=UPI0018F5E805|nr:DUF5077 domain-containing protein [Rugamonas sp. CCM 8940]MBJ7313439.1 DUF5077 domain-containing protein [Rugamonas sp. CCM 8940]
MKRRKLFLYSVAVALSGCGGDTATATTDARSQGAAVKSAGIAAKPVTVALAGNAFITSADADATEVITDQGLADWTSPNTVISTYFRVAAAGPVTVALDARLAGGSNSTVRVTIDGKPFDVKLSITGARSYPVGTVNVAAPGYVKVDLRGISKDGGYFGDVSALKVSANAALNYANDPANYYWSRRGPSVHMGYSVPANTEYFYNEVTVPAGQDKIGSYYMANGFGEGYMGIQVKSDSERWVLFSVWDADNGGKTTLVSKGPDVVDNVFGGEGTGGQSYLRYNWVAGNTYRFVTRVHPDGAGGSDYSAWFYAPEQGAWRYIATWKRPFITTYLTRAHSFLENFIDSNGYMERRVSFGNQWARNVSGAWSELTTGRFTGDATASNGQRLDYAGGMENGKFYLRNGGFFANNVPTNQNFTRPASGKVPDVDVSALPH